MLPGIVIYIYILRFREFPVSGAISIADFFTYKIPENLHWQVAESGKILSARLAVSNAGFK